MANLFIKNIVLKSKLYKIYNIINEKIVNCILIVGKNQIGNDYIIDNASLIIKDIYNVEITNNNLIWLHAIGPSPHFILYKNPDYIININSLQNFIISLCPKKSIIEHSYELHSCILSNVKKTNTIGLVNIKHIKLTKLL
jgi:hypothetical protein